MKTKIFALVICLVAVVLGICLVVTSFSKTVTNVPQDEDIYSVIKHKESYPVSVQHTIDMIMAEVSGDIEQLKKLEELDLSWRQIEDLSPLRYLTWLKKLNLSYNNIESVEPLQYLTNITDLDISYNSRIKDCAAIMNNSSLDLLIKYQYCLPQATQHTLDILIEKASGNIDRLKDLEELDLSRRQLEDLTPLKYLPKLVSLNLWYNDFADLNPLKGLTNLASLVLRFNQVTDISPLKDLTNLVSLDLSLNGITDISPLKGLTNLVSLNLEFNQIEDVRPLRGLKKLTFLNLGHNRINDVSSLKDLPNIKTMNIEENKIYKHTPLGYLQKLLDLIFPTLDI